MSMHSLRPGEWVKGSDGRIEHKSELHVWLEATHPEVLQEFQAIQDLKESVREAEEGPEDYLMELMAQRFAQQQINAYNQRAMVNQQMSVLEQERMRGMQQNRLDAQRYQQSKLYGQMGEQQPEPEQKGLLNRIWDKFK